MLRLLRTRPLPKLTALPIIGVRSGDRVLVVGAGDPALPAELAKVTGLNGHLVVVDRERGAAERVEHAAMQAGALVAFEDAPPTMLPFDPDDFRVVVMNRRLATLSDSDQVGALTEAQRVVKPRGRLVVVEASTRRGLFSLLAGRQRTFTASELQTMLERAGWSASRELANVEGTIYMEARKILSAPST
jgi:ubiquinone/menaquinone biosynthesis C-methylase UbiE